MVNQRIDADLRMCMSSEQRERCPYLRPCDLDLDALDSENDWAEHINAR